MQIIATKETVDNGGLGDASARWIWKMQTAKTYRRIRGEGFSGMTIWLEVVQVTVLSNFIVQNIMNFPTGYPGPTVLSTYYTPVLLLSCSMPVQLVEKSYFFCKMAMFIRRSHAEARAESSNLILIVGLQKKI